MAKAFFRWLRGELNGFYVTNINNALNESTKDIKDLLSEFKTQQFENGKISDKNLYGLGKFAGVFLPRLSREDSITALRMTESFVVDGFECSERGLFNTNNENFSFFHTKDDTINYFVGVNQGTYNNDINLLATPEQRSSLVGTETLIGYISSEETDVLDDYGYVRPEKILATPPEGVAYSDYYGDQFMFLSEAETSYLKLAPSLYIELFKALQWIRYNGTSIKSLGRIINIICPDGLVKLDKVETTTDGKHWNVYYDYDNTVDVTLKLQRLNLLEFIVNLKFIQVSLVENI